MVGAVNTDKTIMEEYFMEAQIYVDIPARRSRLSGEG